PIRISPPPRLTHTIQRPGLGSAVTNPLTSPTPASKAVSPSENASRYTSPSGPLRVAPTKVRTAANAGAPHGAATSPDAAPIANAPPGERPPSAAAQLAMPAGTTSGT